MRASGACETFGTSQWTVPVLPLEPLETHVQRYQIHFFDRLNVKFLIRDWVGKDDLDALDHARKLSTTHAVEVWEDERRIARVSRADTLVAPQTGRQFERRARRSNRNNQDR